MADSSRSCTNRKRSSFAQSIFRENLDLHPSLERLLSFVAWIITCKVRCWVTDTHIKYCNPHCACALRVNYCTCIKLQYHIRFGFSILQLWNTVEPVLAVTWDRRLPCILQSAGEVPTKLPIRYIYFPPVYNGPSVLRKAATSWSPRGIIIM